jgi:hypothetical protein
VNQNNGAAPVDLPPQKNGASNGRAPRAGAKTTSPQLQPEPSKAADAFAERLGRASFISHAGIVVGAAALAFSRNGRWEQSMDRLMERFDRRRRPRNLRRQIEQEASPVETSCSNSSHKSL